MELKVLRKHRLSLREISAQAGMAVNTVRKYLEGGLPAMKRLSARKSKLDPFKDYLAGRIQAAKPDWIPATVPQREIAAQGYTGSVRILQEYLKEWRPKARPHPVVREINRCVAGAGQVLHAFACNRSNGDCSGRHRQWQLERQRICLDSLAGCSDKSRSYGPSPVPPTTLQVVDDRGGNSYQLQAFMRGNNLHAVWDTELIKLLQQDNEQIVKSLLVRPLSLQKTPFNAASIAMQSCRIVSQAGLYPDRLVTPEYVDRYVPIAAYQLATAGYRLAQVLNDLK